jgi:roadblock/LC7 domain-containing protein
MSVRCAQAILGYRNPGAEELGKRHPEVRDFDELLSLDGIIMAGRLGPDWRIAEHKSASFLVANPQALQMAQWFCAAVSTMFNSMAFAVDSVRLGGTFDTSSWLPLRG